MKKYLYYLSAFLLGSLFLGCNQYGKQKIYDGVQLYHTDKVTDQLADTLGNYLVNQKFADGSDKTIQLTKSGDTIQFRMVVKEGVDKDQSQRKMLTFFASMLSAQVFDGAPLQLQLCDDQLKTLKVIPADDYGKQKIFNGVLLFHSKNITDAEVDSLGNYLIKSKFATGKALSVLLTKTANIYHFKFVVKPGVEKNPDYIQNAKVFAGELSTAVFKGAPVEVLMSDDYFTTLAVVPMADPVKKM